MAKQIHSVFVISVLLTLPLVAAEPPNSAKGLKPRAPAQPPVAALAYRPDGKFLAAAGHGEVLLLDTATNEVAGKLPGQSAKVTALAYSHNGQLLAVASGNPAKAGEVRIYSVPPSGLPNAKPEVTIAAHKDLLHDIAFSPDDKQLATCGYDRLIKLWDVATGKGLQTLKDHSDAVYGIAFSPDGKLLASGAADRAVKVWDLATGKRLFTLGEATDWIYAVAWNPDGKRLAGAGVDKSIRVWDVSPAGGKLLHSVFAHEGPVTRLVYSPDGKVLYSLSEDRTVKSWDAARMTEHRVYPKQPEWTLALALRPDRKQLALGRYDGALVLLDEASAQVQAEPLPVKPKPPELAKISPDFGQRGRTVRVALEGKHLRGVTDMVVNRPGVTAKVVNPDGDGSDSRREADLTIPADTPADVYELSVKTAAGQSPAVPFAVDLFGQVAEQESNNTPATGQTITLPVSLAGTIDRAGDIDFYRFEAKEGQELGVQAVVHGSKLEAFLALTDASGRLLAESTNGSLGYRCERAGIYALGIRDREYRGDGTMTYRLHVGDVPVVTAVYPLGVQRGTETEIRLEGVNLGVPSVRVKAPADAARGSSLPLSITTPKGKPLGESTVTVGEFPEIVASPGISLPVPGTANGRIAQPGATHTWRFQAKKGERLIVEVNARRLGSALDSVIEVLDAQGQPVPRATIRSLAKTHIAFRDHDSVQPNVRLEAWDELAVNDYLLVGSELMRLFALPKNPDDDAVFYSVAGQRVGFLDTTPTYHHFGKPMYKVEIHPPGMTFAPNGFPVVTLYYRNDDGGPGYGKDSRLFFDPPADGEYQVRVGDARGEGGSRYAYRLTVRPPRPSFNVSFTPTALSVEKGGAIPVAVTAERIDGFNGPIEVRLENLPPGLSAPATTVPAGENGTAFALFAEPSAAVPPNAPSIKLVAKAKVGTAAAEVVREVKGEAPKVTEPEEILTSTEQSEVTVQPGGQARVTVKVERRKGFAGRVPVEVRGLPHGVRVLDIGLNGILVTEKEASRTFVLYAEPWAEPTAHPFVVLAQREGKKTEHAAKSVLLRVVKPDGR